MTAIVGATVSLRTLVDGSVRCTLDYEPKDAQAAFALFGRPGQPVATVALKPGYGAVGAVPSEPQAPKMGPLCREAVDLCKLAKFQVWVGLENYDEDINGAKGFILVTCEVESRKELDTDPAAKQRFIDRVRVPFMQWSKT